MGLRLVVSKGENGGAVRDCFRLGNTFDGDGVGVGFPRVLLVHVRGEVMTPRKLQTAKLAAMRDVLVNTLLVTSQRGTVEKPFT